MTIPQLNRRIAHVVKLQRHAQRKRRPARVRHYQRMLDALHTERLYLELAPHYGESVSA